MSKKNDFAMNAVALALATVFPVAGAFADEGVDALINPNVAEVTLKAANTDKVNPLYRQYYGVDKTGVNGNADINIVTRSAEGTWFSIKGENLGLTTREVGASVDKQGDWSLGVGYNQIPHYAPYQVMTAVQGIGTNTITQPNLANAAFSGGAQTSPSLYETSLKTERDITTLTASKFLSESLRVAFTFKNEDKTGARMDGVRGNAGTYGTSGSTSVNLYSGFLFAPEPIDQRHKQIDVTIDYSAGKYQLTAGYYGSFLTTTNKSLNVVGGTNTTVYTVTPAITAIALYPDNSLQQFYVSGGYNFSPDTRANLKVSHSEGKQHDTFMSGQVTSNAIGTSLDGDVKTTEVFASLSSRINRDLKLLATWRWENKQDKTPLRDYSLSTTGVAPAGTPAFTTNNPDSHIANWGKLEADYQLGRGYALTAGVDYSSKSKLEFGSIPNNAQNGYQNPEYDFSRSMSEVTGRLDLRKAMSDTVNGNLSVAHSDRKGSEEWAPPPGINTGVTPNVPYAAVPPALYPVYLSDRKRDKVRGLVDWSATENLTLQAAYEAYFDQYDRAAYGLDTGKGQVFSLDGSFKLNETWKANAWYSRQTGDTKQYVQGAVCSTNNNSNCTSNTARAGVPLVSWDALLKANSDQFGLGLTGKWKGLDLGVQYLYSLDKNQQVINGIPATTYTAANVSANVASGMGVLPDTRYSQNTLKLYGVYPIDKATTLRLDYIYDVRKMDDYTWTNWVYADGTRVYVKPEQTTQVVGVSLSYKF